MDKVKIIYWQEDDFWLGYLQDYPSYQTQGETFEELQENLRDIYQDIIEDHIPLVRKAGELVIP